MLITFKNCCGGRSQDALGTGTGTDHPNDANLWLVTSYNRNIGKISLHSKFAEILYQ
jgi:hypothetical protein